MSKSYKRNNRRFKDDDYEDNYSSKLPEKGRNDWKIHRKRIVTGSDYEDEDDYYDQYKFKKR